jgi:hypothetical protein
VAVRLQVKETKNVCVAKSLPDGDAFFCPVFPRNYTETSQDGHCRAFGSSAAFPRESPIHDNSRISVWRTVELAD